MAISTLFGRRIAFRFAVFGLLIDRKSADGRGSKTTMGKERKGRKAKVADTIRASVTTRGQDMGNTFGVESRTGLPRTCGPAGEDENNEEREPWGVGPA